MRLSLFLLSIIASGHAALAQRADTVAAASLRYAHPNPLQKIFIGGNYRKTWAMPVTLRIFRLKSEKGGFTIKALGGGMQTRSLRLEDKAGEQWVLRTVDKTVDKAMEAEGIHSPFIRAITQDMISAAHPYGALVVPPMAHALGVLSTEPEVFFVPDDPAFGQYQQLFANTVCLLEKREPTLDAKDKVKDTKALYKTLKKHPDYRLETQTLLQARLLDMLIGDWDRHGDQWKWDYHAQSNGVVIYPIPRDHDQAFFHSSGLLIRLVRPFALKHIIGYRKQLTAMKQLNRKEWYFDHSLLGTLTEQDWRNGIERFQKAITDDVLREAIKRLLPQVYASQGEWLYHRLQRRRNSMMKEVMKYYWFLQTGRAEKAIDLREKKLTKSKKAE